MASAASLTSNTLPMRVARPARGTIVRGLLSRLQEQNGAVVSWCDLPSDLYGETLRRLPSHRDRVRLTAVCSHWRVCARQHVPRGMCQIPLPIHVTRTRRGTHVVHIRSFSRLQEEQCGVGGFVDSPAFAAGGLDWAIRYFPGSGYRGHVGVFVRLLTNGVVARACVRLLLLDQTTGLADEVIWDQWRTRFDAACAKSCTRGIGMLATRSDLKRSDFVRGDCLQIECALEAVCRDSRLK